MHSIREEGQKIIKTFFFAVKTAFDVRKSTKRGLTLLFTIHGFQCICNVDKIP